MWSTQNMLFCREIIKIRFTHSRGQNWPETISSWTISFFSEPRNYQNKIFALSWTKLTRDNIFLDNFIFLGPWSCTALCHAPQTFGPSGSPGQERRLCSSLPSTWCLRLGKAILTSVNFSWCFSCLNIILKVFNKKSDDTCQLKAENAEFLNKFIISCTKKKGF